MDQSVDQTVDQTEDLLDHLLRTEPPERSALLDALCEAYPQQAEKLRRRYQALERVGMLEQDEQGQPKQIGSFRVLEQLGKGGMGVVYRAEQAGLLREVAVKLLRPEFAWLTPNRQRFLREGRVVARLEHPAIVPILQFGEHLGQPFLVMRYIAGRSLAELLGAMRDTDVTARDGHHVVSALADGTAGVDEVAVGSSLGGLDTRWSQVIARLLLPIAEGLGYAHHHGVVHRDVKPSNILVDRDGRTFLCDFGLASLDQDEQLTRSGALLGSVPYMSPEQVEGTATDARSDVFSFGSVLYEALTSQRPFGATSSSQTMHAIARVEPPKLQKGLPHVEADLLAIVARCLEKRASHRYATGTELASDLRAFVEGRPVKARRLTFAHRVIRLARREPVPFLLATTASLLLLLAASLGGYLWAERNTFAAGHAELQTEQVERELALGFQALARNNRQMAQQHFDHCLAIDATSEAAQAGRQAAVGTSNAPTNTGTEQEPALATPTELFTKATRLLFSGQHGDTTTAKRATQLLRDAVLRSPRARPVYHGMLAMAAATAQDHALAQRTAEAIELTWPESATAAYWAGYARIAYDAERAERSFVAATQIDKAFVAAWAELGTARMLQNKLGSAEQALRTAIELAPDNCKAWLNLGLCQHRAGKTEVAVATLRHAAKLPNAVPGANYNLGVLLAASKPDEAIAAFEAATAQAPDYIEAWYNLGALHTQRGELEEGRAALEQAIKLRQDWADAWRQLGTNRATAGDAGAAAAAYQQVVALAPTDTAAKNYLDVLQRHLASQALPAAKQAKRAAKPAQADGRPDTATTDTTQSEKTQSKKTQPDKRHSHKRQPQESQTKKSQPNKTQPNKTQSNKSKLSNPEPEDRD